MRILADAIKGIVCLIGALICLSIWLAVRDHYRIAPLPKVQPAANRAWDGIPGHPDCSDSGHPDPNHSGIIISDKYTESCDAPK